MIWVDGEGLIFCEYVGDEIKVVREYCKNR